MPNYTFSCPTCGQTKDAVVPIAERDAPESAPRCYCVSNAQIGDMSFTLMTRQPSAPRGIKVQGGTPTFHKTGAHK